MSNSETPDFVSLFVDFYKEYESPTSFWKWAAFSTVSAVLRHNVFFQHGAGKIYANTYTVFLADSAQYRKGAPIMAARRLLNLLKHTKVFSGTASIQAVLDILSQDVAATKNSGTPIRGGSALITADELASFFVSDPRLIPLLTDIWEPRVGENDPFKYELRSMSIIIKDLCPSLLAASNETFLREVYDSRAIYGGLLGRTFMIKPDEFRPPNSLMEMDLTKYDEKPLVDALFKIRDLKGNVRVTGDAAKVYTEWYKDLYNKYKKHPDKTGVVGRMHTQVVKIAIIMSAANYSLEITKTIFEKAILEVASLKQNYELYVMSSGKSSQAEIGTKFLASMWERPDRKIARDDFLLKHWSDVTVEDFDKLIETLKAAAMIEYTVESNGGLAYKMTQRCIDIMAKTEMEKK